MRFIILTFPLILLFVKHSNAQIVDTTGKVSIKTSYLGTILYPGFKVGMEFPYSVKEIRKSRKDRVKVILKEQSWNLNLGFYHHATFHDNLFFVAEWQRRRQKQKGWFYDFTPGLGYSRTFLGGTTYTVDDKGTVDVKKMAGYNYLLLSIGYGVGYNFEYRSGAPIRIYSKMGLISLLPYNSFFYVRPTLEIGCVYKIDRVFSSKVKYSSKLKTR